MEIRNDITYTHPVSKNRYEEQITIYRAYSLTVVGAQRILNRDYPEMDAIVNRVETAVVE